jgi:cobalamin synthase
MTNSGSRWLVPAVGFVLGLLIALAEIGQHASLAQAISAVVIVGGYALALRFLQARSETASLLSGLPVDERWESINLRALSSAAQIIAAVIVGAFIVVEFSGGDAMPYAWLGAVFGLAYLGGILWYRWRS